MTHWHHEIFRAMPKGRFLLAREIYQRAKLPRGWNVLDVAQAMKKFQRDGVIDVEVVGERKRPVMLYRRIA